MRVNDGHLVEGDDVGVLLRRLAVDLQKLLELGPAFLLGRRDDHAVDVQPGPQTPVADVILADEYVPGRSTVVVLLLAEKPVALVGDLQHAGSDQNVLVVRRLILGSCNLVHFRAFLTLACPVVLPLRAPRLTAADRV